MCADEGKVAVIPAAIVEDDAAIWLVRHCPVHGESRERVCSDPELYRRWMKYRVEGEPQPLVRTDASDGTALYIVHRSQPLLIDLDVTNRCDLRCSQCQVCAGSSGVVYEPSLEDLRAWMRRSRALAPGCPALQISGCEPCLREDLLVLVREAKALDFSRVQLMTNGVRLADDAGLCQGLRQAGLERVYLGFSGVDGGVNPLLGRDRRAIENLREAGLGVVLVSLLDSRFVGGAGRVVRFAMENVDVVRGVHFQPTFSCGCPWGGGSGSRVEYGELLRVLKGEFAGMVAAEDFYPFPVTFAVTHLIEGLTGVPQAKCTAHPMCGGSTFVFLDDGRVVPLTRFVDVDGSLAFFREQARRRGPMRKLRVATAFIKNIDTYTDYRKAPRGFDLRQLLRDAALAGEEYAFRRYQRSSFFVGVMGQQDRRMLDLDRLQRCVIHCATGDGLVPWCSYTALGFREKIHRQCSVPVEVWERQHGRLLCDDARVELARGG